MIHFPQILRIRRQYKSRVIDTENPSIALVGDNLDEVNGIALNSRVFVREMKRKNRMVYLLGVAFHNKIPRMETNGGNIFMLPGKCSMKQPGYEQSETAIPKLGLFIKLLKKYPVDLIELETPNTVCVMAFVVAKIIGIHTVTHYRTDVISYANLLVKNKLAAYLVCTWVRFFVKKTGLVIIPSRAFVPRVKELGVAESKIHILPRGVDLIRFNPEKKNNGIWEKQISPEKKLRLLYVGRISREKNLPLILEQFNSLAENLPDFEFAFVGDGPYLETLKEKTENISQIFCTGVVTGDQLANIYASADIFIFPSTTDTFGNSVIEALASGVPCIVSDGGGPSGDYRKPCIWSDIQRKWK